MKISKVFGTRKAKKVQDQELSDFVNYIKNNAFVFNNFREHKEQLYNFYEAFNNFNLDEIKQKMYTVPDEDREICCFKILETLKSYLQYLQTNIKILKTTIEDNKDKLSENTLDGLLLFADLEYQAMCCYENMTKLLIGVIRA